MSGYGVQSVALCQVTPIRIQCNTIFQWQTSTTNVTYTKKRILGSNRKNTLHSAHAIYCCIYLRRFQLWVCYVESVMLYMLILVLYRYYYDIYFLPSYFQKMYKCNHIRVCPFVQQVCGVPILAQQSSIKLVLRQSRSRVVLFFLQIVNCEKKSNLCRANQNKYGENIGRLAVLKDDHVVYTANCAFEKKMQVCENARNEMTGAKQHTRTVTIYVQVTHAVSINR